MRLQTIIPGFLIALTAITIPIAAARADTVMYDGTTFVEGQQSFVQSFNISGPGTLTVTLATISWLDVISNLTGFVTTDSGVLGSTMSAGTESFQVDSGTLYAHWFGNAQGSFGIGVLGVKIEFQPSVVTPVPLPASLLLLLSGLGVLFGWQRRERQTGAAIPQ
jgi:hypothetical protein